MKTLRPILAGILILSQMLVGVAPAIAWFSHVSSSQIPAAKMDCETKPSCCCGHEIVQASPATPDKHSCPCIGSTETKQKDNSPASLPGSQQIVLAQIARSMEPVLTKEIPVRSVIQTVPEGFPRGPTLLRDHSRAPPR